MFKPRILFFAVCVCVFKQGGLFATFGGKLIDPLVVKDSFLGVSQIFSEKVAKGPPVFKPIRAW